MFYKKKSGGGRRGSRRAHPCTPSPPPYEEVQELEIDHCQLSLGIRGYGIDDHHMDRTEGFEDAHLSTPEDAHLSTPNAEVGASVQATNEGSNG